MADIPEQTTRSLKDRVERLEEDTKLKELVKDTEKEKKEWKYPWKWKNNMNKSLKPDKDKVLVIFLNIKGEVETPILIPIYSGNIVIYRHKAYEFDPRAIWTINMRKKVYKVLLIKEIDRRPVSNLDWDEIKARGDATDSDEILIKMALKSVIEKPKSQMNPTIIWIVIVLIIGGIIFFMTRK